MKRQGTKGHGCIQTLLTPPCSAAGLEKDERTKPCPPFPQELTFGIRSERTQPFPARLKQSSKKNGAVVCVLKAILGDPRGFQVCSDRRRQTQALLRRTRTGTAPSQQWVGWGWGSARSVLTFPPGVPALYLLVSQQKVLCAVALFLFGLFLPFLHPSPPPPPPHAANTTSAATAATPTSDPPPTAPRGLPSKSHYFIWSIALQIDFPVQIMNIYGYFPHRLLYLPWNKGLISCRF